MKRLSLYIILLSITFGMGVSTSSAARSPTAPIVGEIPTDTTGKGHAGTGVLNWTGTFLPPVSGTGEVYIDTDNYFHGNFFFQGLSDGTQSPTNPGWTTFNICQEQESGATPNPATCTLSGTTTIAREVRAHLVQSGSSDIYYMTGVLWSQWAGWIYPTWVMSGSNTPLYNGTQSVIYNKATGTFSGFMWSDNVGFIAMEGLYLDITPPSALNFQAFAASGSKVFTLTDPSPVTSGLDLYKFEVDDWDDDATWYKSVYNAINPNFTHDFRKAKDTYYHLRITDSFGNSSEGTVKVVADVPSDILSATNIGGTASTYISTFADSRVADAVQAHSLSMNLRDTYGNPVKNESGIKTVNVRIAFNNNVDRNQSLSADGVLGDAIQFPDTEFANLIGMAPTASGTASNTTGAYLVDILSYAPTKAGYAFANNDNISLQKLSYEVIDDKGNWWVGEVVETEKKDKFGTNPLKFSPALYIGNVTNSDNWNTIQGYDTTFTATFLTGTTVSSLTEQKVMHILDIDSNILMSYQDPSNIIGGTKDCDGYRKSRPGIFGASDYVTSGSSPSLCDRSSSSSSNILISNPSNTMKFSWIPKIIIAAPVSSAVKYTSEISYKNGWVEVRYPSFYRSSNSTLLADGTTVASTDTGLLTNQSVKILGTSNGANIFNTLTGTTANNVASLTRVDIKNAIHRNVVTLTQWGATGTGTRYQVYTGNTPLNSWPDGKDTIIVQGGDLTINSNISNEATIKGIIVLEDANGNGGNIFISKTVSNIAAVLYTDKSIVSGTSSPVIYYSDARTATGQLFVQGSVISDNTIGGASMTPLKCPYNVTGCTDQIAKRYDLNYFRFYTGTGASSPGAAPGVPAAGFSFPFVIEYDNRLQTAPPPGFSIAP